MRYVLWIFFLSMLNLDLRASMNPNFDFSVFGGKYYLDGESSSLDLNLNAVASPVINFNENNALYPVYIGYYTGVEDVQELVGGDVLVRQRMGHSFSLKYVHSNDFNYIKPRLSYSLDYINETKDESWGDGLFDYNTLSAGIDFEQERPEATYRESFDYFYVHYPNYSSLISQSETVLDTTTYKEISQNAGEDVLDSRNYRVGFEYVKFPRDLMLTYSLNLTYKDYFDQSVVDSLGGFKSDKRNDLLTELGARIEKSDKKVYLGMEFDFRWLNSNQNSYDATRTKYIDDYYSYINFDLTPRIQINLNDKGSFSYSFTYTRLNYIERLAQDVNGNYSGSKIHQNFYINSISLKYKVYENLYARGIYSYQVVDSNMNYEAGYKYDYKSSNFMAGVEWEF
ncbi:MAG: hypothetical protein GX445_03005 [Elusimicrobia bacterium]|nr:hypothetical protein [Elusimicrobiota bacterium]